MRSLEFFRPRREKTPAPASPKEVEYSFGNTDPCADALNLFLVVHKTPIRDGRSVKSLIGENTNGEAVYVTQYLHDPCKSLELGPAYGGFVGSVSLEDVKAKTSNTDAARVADTYFREREGLIPIKNIVYEQT